VWSPLSDEALLAGYRARDPDASAAFVRRFQTRVFGLALTILGDRAEAEEAAQEAFVRAWRRADAYDPTRGEVATWLLAIARNVAIDHARMRRSQPAGIDPTVLLGNAADLEASPEERRVAADDAARLWAAIATLPIEQRRALLQASFLGRTAREIGMLDGTPIGTVKTRIRAAMLKLHGLLEVRDG
jgi:RNA polymerase sigma factor (sigma-70 family)